MATFGERLCELRKERKLNQTQLGDTFGIATSTISAYESMAIDPGRVRIEALADFFRVRVDYLLGRTDDRGPLTVREPDPELIIIHGARELTDGDREDLAKYGEWLKERRRQQLKAGKPTPGRE